MKQIQIGKTIAKCRRERGLTQEDLARYFNISKPAVSKWESGQSYPDITLLPAIATFFGITIDELIDFQPQMTKEDIKKLYLSLSEDFSASDFEETYQICEDYVKKYYSCWPLLTNISALLLNYVNLAPSKDKQEDVFRLIFELTERVEEMCDDKVIAAEALYLRATAYLIQGRPAETIQALSQEEEVLWSRDSLLANAYLVNGNKEKAVSLAQKSIYNDLMGILSAAPILLSAYVKDFKAMERWVHTVEQMIATFDVKKMHPAAVMPLYLNIAALYVENGEPEKALCYLEQYVDCVINPDCFPLRLRGSVLFDRMEQVFERLDLGVFPPRSEKAIKESIRDAVLKSPEFLPLHKTERFQKIRRILEALS